MKKRLLFSIFVFLFFTLASPVLAISFGGLGIRPAYPVSENPATEAWFIYNLLPGETKQDWVTVSNSTGQVLSAKIYPVDGTTTADGAFALLDEKDERKNVGQWVSLSINEVTVQPGKEKLIPFTISIPTNASVGDHLGGIILENLSIKKDNGVNIVTRVGARIYETVPGELVKKLVLADFYWQPTKRGFIKKDINFYFDLKNEGNVHLGPKGTLVIKDAILGTTIANFDFDLRMIVPGKPTKVPVTWKTHRPLGRFTAQAVINYGEKPSEQIEAEISFWYIAPVAGIALLMAGIILVLSFLKKLL